MIYRPGPGWQRAGTAPVYEHSSGLRVHTGGLVRLPNGHIVNGYLWPESSRFWRAVRICGGNQRRGAMVWALWCAEKVEEQ